MSNIRNEKCLVCDQSIAKYTCPRCDAKTCCLQCVKIHKLVLECDGIRENYRFVPLDKFDNIQLLNDYRFLESTARDLSSARRNYDQIYEHFTLKRVKNKRRRQRRNKVREHLSK